MTENIYNYYDNNNIIIIFLILDEHVCWNFIAIFYKKICGSWVHVYVHAVCPRFLSLQQSYWTINISREMLLSWNYDNML